MWTGEIVYLKRKSYLMSTLFLIRIVSTCRVLLSADTSTFTCTVNVNNKWTLAGASWERGDEEVEK